MNASCYRDRNKRAAEPKTATPANTQTPYFCSVAPCVQETSPEQRKMAELTSRLSALCEERSKAAYMRVFDEYLANFPDLKDVFPLRRKNGDGSFVFKNLKAVQLQLSGHGNIFNKNAKPKQVRETLIEALTCPFTFKWTIWQVKPTLNPELPDDENLIFTDSDLPVERSDDVKELCELISDTMDMVCKLARQISSCESQRILRCRVALADHPCIGLSLPRSEAESLVDEFIYCVAAIKAEIESLPPDERATLARPKMPRRHPDIVVHGTPPEDMPPEECTKREREAAYKRMRNENIFLLTSFGFNCERSGPIDDILGEVKAISDALDAGRPSFDRGRDGLDYKLLGDVLSADLYLYYERYFMTEDVTSDGKRVEYRTSEDVSDTSEEQKKKDAVIKYLDNILSKSLAIAAECGSKTRDLWTDLIAIFQKRGGNFQSFMKMDDDQASADLQKFLTDFCQARQRLYVDWQNAGLKEKPLATNQQGPVETIPRGPHIEKLEKETKSIRQTDENILHYASDAQMGLAPTDGRRKTLIRGQMADKGEALVRDKGYSAPQAAKEVIRRTDGQPLAYKMDEEDALRKAIERETKSDGVTLPNQRT